MARKYHRVGGYQMNPILTTKTVWRYGSGTGLNDEECRYDHAFACQADECFWIEHCKLGSKCPWNSYYFSWNICDECNSGYYSGGFGQGCIDCVAIVNCQEETCTSATDQTCVKCIDNNVFFKLTNNDRSCDRMCSSDKHYCWPGTCSNDLASNCECTSGFTKQSSIHETLCQPETKPEIHSCHTVFTGPNGEKKRLLSSTESSHCKDLRNTYGNFQLTSIIFNMTSELTIDISSVERPLYIKTELFGVTDTTVTLQKQETSGQEWDTSSHQLTTDTTFGEKAKSVVHNDEALSVVDMKYELNNGDALCIKYQAKGGGYFESVHQYQFTVENVAYEKTITTETKCYRFDNASPEHCAERNICQYEPLQLSERITRSGIVDVAFQGWYDPIPNHNYPAQASDIEQFEIRVSEVILAGEQLKVDTTIYYEEKVSSTGTENVTLNLTVPSPRLFCVLVEVKDVADNVRQARRFVLSDKNSMLKVSKDNPFIINSAVKDTGYLWQTSFKSICLSWKDHFYNDFYLHNPLLNPIEPDRHGLITGVYEQSEGTLSVHGTPNVHGIVKYLVSWQLSEDSVSEEIEIENFQHQNFCRDFDLKDGQTYTFYVSPVDIVRNKLIENRTVHIDTSPPHIDRIGLIKDGFKGLAVHDERDLSKMDLYFEALDPHSGVLNVEWWFGKEDTGQVLGSGVLGVQRIKGDCEASIPSCYCPDVGACENHAYIIPLNKLVVAHNHLGDHNRNYFFELKASNNARISATEYMTVLVDYSPPEVGIIYDGAIDDKDIDYTSEDSIAVTWYGFVDHESGINMYRIGFANRCLHAHELYHYENTTAIIEYAEVDYTVNSVRVNVDFIGKMYVSIIAFNNAMDPSESVCSDGVTRDINTPKFYNLYVAHLSTSVTYFCLDNKVWILNSNISLYINFQLTMYVIFDVRPTTAYYHLFMLFLK